MAMTQAEYVEDVARRYHAMACKSYLRIPGPAAAGVTRRNTFETCPEPLCVEGRAQLEEIIQAELDHDNDD